MSKFTDEQIKFLEQAVTLITLPGGKLSIGSVNGSVLDGVNGSVFGKIGGEVYGIVEGNVWGNINGNVGSVNGDVGWVGGNILRGVGMDLSGEENEKRHM